ncbi:hypothetical protein ABZP36_016422 [Zizania latifolia]
MHVARAQAVSYDEVVDWNETPLPDDEVLKHGNKKKRPLTEERKAKKKKNKRIKRAQQLEAEGVKRLKLQPVIKPKVVQYCRYYLLGRCQQGNLCKFSHDTTPLTKSKPCTHFARGSCLKGDDCPYDHELSKYPCHTFLENGMCTRGDKCKFSHAIPTGEGSSTPNTKKSDAFLVPEKANHREQTSSHKTSTMYSGEPVTCAPTKHHSILKNLAGISGNAQKAYVRIPKGIQFLPFNKARSDSSILHQDILSTEKHKHIIDGQHQKFGGPQPAEGENIAKHSGLRSAPLLDENSPKQANVCLHSEPKKNSLPTTTAVPGSHTWMLLSDELMPMRSCNIFHIVHISFLVVTASCDCWCEFGAKIYCRFVKIGSGYSQQNALLFNHQAFRASSFFKEKNFTSLPCDNGSYKIAVLVFDQHDFAYMCTRTMGPSQETSVSLVQCMV